MGLLDIIDQIDLTLICCLTMERFQCKEAYIRNSNPGHTHTQRIGKGLLGAIVHPVDDIRASKELNEARSQICIIGSRVRLFEYHL